MDSRLWKDLITSQYGEPFDQNPSVSWMALTVTHLSSPFPSVTVFGGHPYDYYRHPETI